MFRDTCDDTAFTYNIWDDSFPPPKKKKVWFHRERFRFPVSVLDAILGGLQNRPFKGEPWVLSFFEDFCMVQVLPCANSEQTAMLVRPNRSMIGNPCLYVLRRKMSSLFSALHSSSGTFTTIYLLALIFQIVLGIFGFILHGFVLYFVISYREPLGVIYFKGFCGATGIRSEIHKSVRLSFWHRFEIIFIFMIIVSFSSWLQCEDSSFITAGSFYTRRRQHERAESLQSHVIKALETWHLAKPFKRLNYRSFSFAHDNANDPPASSSTDLEKNGDFSSFVCQSLLRWDRTHQRSGAPLAWLGTLHENEETQTEMSDTCLFCLCLDTERPLLCLCLHK